MLTVLLVSGTLALSPLAAPVGQAEEGSEEAVRTTEPAPEPEAEPAPEPEAEPEPAAPAPAESETEAGGESAEPEPSTPGAMQETAPGEDVPGAGATDQYLVTYLNGDQSSVVYTTLESSGVTVPKPSIYLLESQGFTYPDDKYFENTWEYADDGRPVDFSKDLVTSDITLRPILYDAVRISFDTGTANPPATIRAKKGSTLGEVILPLASSVSRPGYIPRYWQLPGGSGAVPFDHVLNADITLEMKYDPLEDGVPYQIVYWVEKPNLGVNFAPRPGNPTHYDYAYTETLGGVGTPGEIIGGPGIGADIEINSIPGASYFDYEDPMRWAKWQATEPTTLTGDGLTIVNVYCTLRTYRIIFDIDPDGETGRTMSGDPDGDGTSTSYGLIPYTLTFKFGDNVAARWPHPSRGWEFIDPDGQFYSYWEHPTLAVASGDWQTTRTDITGAMMPVDPASSGYRLKLVWTNVTDTVTMHYWGEELPEQANDDTLTRREWNGRTWVLLPSYTASIPPATDFQSKAIPGFLPGTQGDYSDEVTTTSFPTAQTSEGRWHNYVNHYYMRRTNPLSYDVRGHGTAPETANVPFGASLADYDIVLPNEPGWTFKGWYADASGTLRYPFEHTMPAYDVTLYAKWESTDHTVTFVDSDGTPLASDGSQVQGVQNGHTVNFNNLTIGGQRYVAKETNDSARGALDGWDRKATPTSPKQAFDPDTALFGDLVLYARWQTTELAITYHQLDGTLVGTDDSDGNGYRNGVMAVVRDGTGVECPEDTVFVGWRIDATGAVYLPDAGFRVAGNPHFYPFCPASGGDLDDVTYVANGNWVVSFLDGYGSVILTEEVAPGATATIPLREDLNAAGFSIPTGTTFEDDWALDGVEYNFLTPVEGHLVLRPILYDVVHLYFETLGSPVDAMTVRKDSLIGMLTIPDIHSIERPGYNALYWTLDPPTARTRAPIEDDYVVSEDTTLFLVWEAVENGSPYHVVYWVERPNLGPYTSPTPGNPDHYVLGYQEPAARYATAGQTVGGTGAEIAIDSLPSTNPFEADDPMRYAQWQQTETTVVRGDGATIVNVYCQLRVYWFQFKLTDSHQVLTFDSDLDGVPEDYTTKKPLELPYKFGQQFGNTWPHPDTGAVFTVTSGMMYNYWKAPSDTTLVASTASKLWSTPRISATAELMPRTPTRSTPITLTLSLVKSEQPREIRYWAEPTPEQTAGTQRSYAGQPYYLMEDLNAQMRWSASYLPKAVRGMSVVLTEYQVSAQERSETETSEAIYLADGTIDYNQPYVHFYYSRDPADLIYDTRGHGSVDTVNLKFGYSMANYNITLPSTESAKFLGWYADSNLTLPFDFNQTIGTSNVIVYAKWESNDHTITFVDSDGSPLATDGSDTQGVANGDPVNFNALTIGGLHFLANYLSDPIRGVFTGWAYKPTGKDTLHTFPTDTKVYRDYTLYARWKTTGLFAYYHALTGPTIGIDKGPDEAGYAQGASVTAWDTVGIDPGCVGGQTFIGWRINGKGAIYAPGASFVMAGEPHLYPYCKPAYDDGALVRVTFASNTGSGWGLDVDGDGIDDPTYQMVRGNNANTLVPAEVPAFTRKGYRMTGWNTAADGSGTQYGLGAEFIATASTQTLYAQWVEDRALLAYTVSNRDYGHVLHCGEGDPLAGTSESLGVVTGQPCGALAEPASEGYRFAGWYSDGKLVSTDPLLVPGKGSDGLYASATYEARFEPVMYDVTFRIVFVDLEGNQRREPVVLGTQAVAHGSPATAPMVNVPEGYDFTAWDKAFSNVTGNMVVTGTLVLKRFTVIFADYDDRVISTQKVYWGEDAVAPPDPTRAGHRFTAWDPAGWTNVKRDLLIHAQYDTVTHIVIFVDQDGNEIDREIVADGGSVNPPHDPEWEGHEFEGWDKEKELENVTEDLIVSPIFHPLSYTVTFLDHDDTVLSVQQVLWGDAATEVLPDHSSHHFVEWDQDFSVVKSDLVVRARCEALRGSVPHGGGDDEPAETASPTLPYTGSDPWFAVFLGVAMVLCGAGIRVIGRPRRQSFDLDDEFHGDH
ncbi:MAG: InlB B-repeat-containing protein [Propionibacteriaceae bacterium]|nr:InlB B-repeat-containing protein [Propionibacteriaceae bacterium]